MEWRVVSMVQALQYARTRDIVDPATLPAPSPSPGAYCEVVAFSDGTCVACATGFDHPLFWIGAPSSPRKD